MTANPALVLAAHGSADPRFDQVIRSLAAIVAASRPELDVRIGYLDHGPPDLRGVAQAGAIVVPVLLSHGFHVGTDIARQAPDCVIARPIGPDPRLTTVLISRLREAGWSGQRGLALAAAGSQDPQALADVRQVAADLGARLGVEVTAAFLSAGQPRLAELEVEAVATYLLAPGHFAEVAAAVGGSIVAAPLGADPVLAEIILDRYDAATGSPVGPDSTFSGAEKVESSPMVHSYG
jgi:sirohydrochlorin ferrochelatase